MKYTFKDWGWLLFLLKPERSMTTLSSQENEEKKNWKNILLFCIRITIFLLSTLWMGYFILSVMFDWIRLNISYDDVLLMIMWPIWAILWLLILGGIFSRITSCTISVFGIYLSIIISRSSVEIFIILLLLVVLPLIVITFGPWKIFRLKSWKES
jgi:hypothetical protein